MRTDIEEIIDLKDTLGELFYNDCDEEFPCNEYGMPIDEIYDYDYNYGASKLVFFLDNCVLKVPFVGWFYGTGSDYYEVANYCVKEVSLYKKAKQEGVSKFFLKSRMITPEVELQEKADGTYLAVPDTNGKEESIKSSFSAYANSRLPISTRAILQMNYSQSDLDKFCAFIEKYKVNDLSMHNMCVKDNRVMFMDYSGFYDC